MVGGNVRLENTDRVEQTSYTGLVQPEGWDGECEEALEPRWVFPEMEERRGETHRKIVTGFEHQFC